MIFILPELRNHLKPCSHFIDTIASELAYGHGVLHANFCHIDCVLNIQGKLKILKNCCNTPEGGNGGGKLGKIILSCSPHRLCTIINGFPKVVPR